MNLQRLSRPRFAPVWFALGLLGLLALRTSSRAAEENATVEARLADSVKYLASDELEGRGVGTEGLNKAADYIAGEFARLGLKTDSFDGSPFQKFTIFTDAELGPAAQNRLTLVGPPEKEGGEPHRIELKLGKDFNPQASGGSGTFDLPLVFVGYGITAKELKYDDYAGLDVKDKVVVFIRKEPQQANPHSVFDGERASQHATFMRKISNAFEHGAAAIIMVNDNHSLRAQAKAERKRWQEAIDKLTALDAEFKKVENPMPDGEAKHRIEVGKLAEQIHTLGKRLDGDFDQVLDFQGAGPSSSHKKTPVFFAARSMIDPVVKLALGKDLATIEQEIDKELVTQSKELAGWKGVGETNDIHKQAEIKNLVGVLEGEGPLADETVVVGAHYDHVGLGGTGSGSLAPWTKDIHNGADDNASGTASLLEIARRFATAEKKPKRRMLFMAFTGEERGLLGSAHYVKNPKFALEKTVAMVNLDMVGRLKDDKLVVYGTGTAKGFDSLVDDLNKKYAFKLTKTPGGFGPSDHASFYAKQIPVFHMFTGNHNDYHRPSDDADKINIEGMRRVTDFTAELTAAIVDGEKRPEYIEVKRAGRPGRPGRGGDADRPYVGTIPDFGGEAEGYALQGVTKDSPADKAGIKAGDVIIKVGESKIGGLEDFDSAIRKFKAGDKVPFTVKRGKESVTLPVTLDPPR